MIGMSISPCGARINISTPGRARWRARLCTSDTRPTQDFRALLAGLGMIRTRVSGLHLEPEFIPVPSADGWQISNPPILSMAPLRASLAIFDKAGGMEALRAKSIKLTGYLQFLLSEPGGRKLFNVITPNEPDARGCQLSILVHEHPKELFGKLQAAGVKCDFREPNVIRAAPTPLYNTFHEVWRFAKILSEHQ